MADKKVSELSAITNLSGDDLLLVVNDPSGTPQSNKVTLTNLFANVVPNIVHKGTFTNTANTTFSGTKMTITANVTIDGTNILDAINDRMQVANVEAYLANTNARLTTLEGISADVSNSYLTSTYTTNATFQSTLANTNNRFASVVLTVNDRMQVANVQSLVNDRLQVANASATYVSNTDFQTFVANNNNQISTLVSNNYIQTVFADGFVGNSVYQNNLAADALNLSSNSVTVSSNTGFRITGKAPDPATSNAANEGILAGSIFYSNTHLYIATDSNTIKRVVLSTF